MKLSCVTGLMALVEFALTCQLCVAQMSLKHSLKICRLSTFIWVGVCTPLAPHQGPLTGDSTDLSLNVHILEIYGSQGNYFQRLKIHMAWKNVKIKPNNKYTVYIFGYVPKWTGLGAISTVCGLYPCCDLLAQWVTFPMWLTLVRWRVSWGL